MTSSPFSVRPEVESDITDIDNLTAAAFGPGMTARAAHVLREGVEHMMPLSFVATNMSRLVGSVRLTPVLWGGKEVLMLGPLCVHPQQEGQGIGRTLMKAAIGAAQKKADDNGHDLIFLVGDLAYYQPFGFQPIPPNQIALPRPADPARVLACELLDGAMQKYSGPARGLGV